jgi:hypothetical protein
LLAEGQIRREPARNYDMKWGEGRIYFADLKAPAYPWLKENLARSPARTPATITAKWVFPLWDPERTNGPTIKDVRSSDTVVEVIFDENVTVDGQPLAILSSGKHAKCISGSGSNTLKCQADGRGRPVRIELNGGAIFSSAASLHRRDAALELPSGHN